MFRILALVCTPSVRMPAWAPVSETASTPSACSAMAVRAMVVCSPVARSTSISRSFGNGMISLASWMRLSVTPLIAETTTTIWSPPARYFATRAATFLIRSVLPTEVPPYFCTINAMGQLSVVRTLESYHLHHRFLVWFHDDWFEASRLDRVVRVFQTVPGH